MRKITGNHLISKNSLVDTAMQTKNSQDAKDLSSGSKLIIPYIPHAELNNRI